MDIKTTTHKTIIGAAQNMHQIESNSIDLVVTSPPYPMIEMWDDIMALQNPKIATALTNKDPHLAFELMHLELDKIWKEVSRVLKDGGFACINIGDATRTINSNFALYPNHARIISAFQKLEIPNLPNIIWRKQTNAPNKFMGSGMLPAGAYVTLEHEWVLIFRKGGKREFKTPEDKLRRQESSFFWEERNVWFSDLWDLKGTKQKIDNSKSRKRSAAYPFELPYRLINMYSLQNDVVLDPFLGTGTTALAAMASQRNSIGYEIDPKFSEIISENIQTTSIADLNMNIDNRINNHREFIINRQQDPKKKEIKHFNNNLNLPVITSQEKKIKFHYLKEIIKDGDQFRATYSEYCHSEVLISAPKKSKEKATLSDL